mgnify:CR=1 FL=1
MDMAEPRQPVESVFWINKFERPKIGRRVLEAVRITKPVETPGTTTIPVDLIGELEDEGLRVALEEQRSALESMEPTAVSVPLVSMPGRQLLEPYSFPTQYTDNVLNRWRQTSQEA